MPKETNLELKVGAFVLAAIGCLLLIILSISNFSFFERGHVVKVMFGYANGLKKAAPVRLAGVEAGIVKAIDIITEGASMKVKVEVWIHDGINIPNDSKLTINQLGLLGEKYIEITPGQSQQIVADGGTLMGIDPVPVDRITQRIDGMTAKLEQTMDSLNNGVLNKANTQAFSEILASVRDIVKEVQQGHGTVGQFMSNPAIYKNLEELSSDLKENPWKLLYRPKAKK